MDAVFAELGITVAAGKEAAAEANGEGKRKKNKNKGKGEGAGEAPVPGQEAAEKPAPAAAAAAADEEPSDDSDDGEPGATLDPAAVGHAQQRRLARGCAGCALCMQHVQGSVSIWVMTHMGPMECTQSGGWVGGGWTWSRPVLQMMPCRAVHNHHGCGSMRPTPHPITVWLPLPLVLPSCLLRTAVPRVPLGHSGQGQAGRQEEEGG